MVDDMTGRFESDLAVTRALSALGELLRARELSFECIVAGGSAIAMIDMLARTTSDIDIVCVRTASGEVQRAQNPLPNGIVDASVEVARLLGLPENWFNSVMAGGYAMGLPSGFEDRLSWRRYDSLGESSRRSRRTN